MAKRQKRHPLHSAIHTMALTCQDNHHGEIFAEFYITGLDDKITVQEFIQQLKEWAKEVIEEEPATTNFEKGILGLIDLGQPNLAILEYFMENPSHGEWAGAIMAACYNDMNAVLAEQLFEVINGDYDS